MKKNMLVLVSLFAIIAMLVTSAGLPPGYVNLIASRFIPGKGVVFLFEAEGVRPSALHGYANFSGTEFKLDCNYRNETIVSCVAGNGISQFEGHNVMVVLAGQGFYTTIPLRRVSCSWGFTTTGPAGSWYYIFDNFEAGALIVAGIYNETVVPGSVHCIKEEWSPNQDWFPNWQWYEAPVSN